jgi:N-acetylneuraminic acid mutarotase
MYVLGGYADGFVDQPLNDEYDPATNTWRERAPMPRGLNHVGAVGLNGKIYCVGGFLEQNRNAVTDVSVYDPATDHWQKLAPLPSPLGSVALAALDGRIHAVGGRDKISVGTHRLYDPTTDRWSELAPLPEGRDHLGLASAGGKLYAIGGRFNTFEYNTNLLDIYEPASNSWKSAKPMPTARSGTAVSVLEERIFVFGGERLGGTFSQAEAYRPDQWQSGVHVQVGWR